MMLTTLTAEIGWRGRNGETARSPSRQGWAVVMWRVVVMGEIWWKVVVMVEMMEMVEGGGDGGDAEDDHDGGCGC